VAADLDARITIPTTGTDIVIAVPDAAGGTTGFELIAVGLPLPTWRRTTAEGRYQHGRALLGAVRDQGTIHARVRTTGPTWIACQNRLTELITALAASVTVTVTVAGHVSSWRCEPADFANANGDYMDELRAMACQQEWELTIPATEVVA